MIRYVDLCGQDTGYRFAFWDTVTDRFIQVGDDQAWDDLADLEESAETAKIDKALVDRMARLIPATEGMKEVYDRDRALALLSYDECFLTKEIANGIANDIRGLLSALEKIASDDPINPEMGNQGVDADRMSFLAREALK